MKKLGAICSVGILFWCPFLLQGKPVEMDAGNITFNIPDDFTPLSAAEIDRKFPRRNGPLEAFGNDTRGVSICCTVSSQAVRPDQLPDLKAALENQLPKLTPGLQWIKKDIVEIKGTQWVCFEFTSQAADNGLIHNIMMITSNHGVMVAINFNSTAKLFGAYEQKLRDDIQTVQVKKSAT
jgi:hypothetical protein